MSISTPSKEIANIHSLWHHRDGCCRDVNVVSPANVGMGANCEPHNERSRYDRRLLSHSGYLLPCGLSLTVSPTSATKRDNHA